MDSQVSRLSKLVSDMNDEEYELAIKFSELSKGVQWYEARHIIADSLSDKEFRLLYCSEKLLMYLDKLFKENPYTLQNTLDMLFSRHRHLARDIMKNSKSGTLKMKLIEDGYFEGVEDIDSLADMSKSIVRLYAVERCSIEKLKELRKDSDKKVRLAAYRRLGIDEYLDEMLDDKCLEVRLAAAASAPMYYPKLSEMTDELSLRVFRVIAKKIDTKQIPYMLGNRNVNKSAYVKKVLEQRLSNGNIKFV